MSGLERNLKTDLRVSLLLLSPFPVSKNLSNILGFAEELLLPKGAEWKAAAVAAAPKEEPIEVLMRVIAQIFK